MGWEGWPYSSQKAAPCAPTCQSLTPGTSSGHCAPRPYTTYWFVNAAGPRRPTDDGLRPLCSASCSLIPSKTDASSARDCSGRRVAETGVRF